MDVFFLAHTDERGIQVLLATLRLVGYVRKVVNDSSLKVLVVRGSESQMAVAMYLVGALDITQAPSTAPPGIQLRSPTGSTKLVRIFYLAYANSQAAEQQIMAALRNVLEVKSVFNFYVPPAIAVRGSADEMSAAQWLVQSLDIAPDPKSPPPVAREFHITGIAREDNVVGVFYSPKSKPGSLTASAIDNPQALVVRGSAGQIAAAEQLMQ
jgi:hypothetical protein